MSDVKQSSELFELAKDAMNKAYVPYSRFHVGAAILTAGGKIYSGCNVENAAYPEGTCAEAGAIASMVLGGDTLIKDIYVIGKGEELVTPCGGCRQKIREFSSVDTMIHICGAEGVRKSLTMNELLPFSFGPENLDQQAS
ncbi:MAG: cytidine deaminase [Gammaproteobacteria bacterium]|uniref:cytidine deaminase n=1 Tax=Marinomonas TaxID=28253 RepID=UPI000C1E7892|nr:cytidine deaminase [Marinomonas sp. BSi20584]MBU1296490.1 cytidine deaminase [Gammaproteobacteria bacterium]MBU1467143.1 cytidine deaminase [Gammaproteobacteria bacterium]MBU2024217.1 cytidine deaminase [Gammaproteobacteria bacterium]MBU2239940.1 cytidine deaminase [Gammaproteobacteria bacterium]MBU2319950.1 cytidine deaminase [Gammaproteobacteria bacterium]